MLSSPFMSEVSSVVADVRKQKGINRRELADRSNVGVRFITIVEEAVPIKWNRFDLIRKLLRVLNALSLQDTAKSVKLEIRKSGKKPRHRRMKYDKGFQVALSKKGCRMR